MITKELFIKTINELEKMSKKEESIMQLGICLIEITCVYEQLITEILKDQFNDESDWIGYFMYELEYGAKYHDGCIIDKEKGNIKLATPSDLFDLLMDNQFNKMYEEFKAKELLRMETERTRKTAYEYERGL